MAYQFNLMNIKIFCRPLLSTLCLSLTISWMLTGVAKAHEFWIEPEEFVIDQGQELHFALMVGTDFKGFQQLYIPSRFERFDLISPQGTVFVDGRVGDRPAGQITPNEEGLHIIRHETNVETIIYENLGKFASFTTEKGLMDAFDQHRQRGLEDVNFIEDYRRYAKSLIGVGHYKGHDQVLGMAVEITALDNPYTMTGDSMSFQLHQDNAPWGNAQVMVFSHPLEDENRKQVQRHIYKTNSLGTVTIPVKLGHAYLIDAVSLTPLNKGQSDNGAVWLSRWASLTFARP